MKETLLDSSVWIMGTSLEEYFLYIEILVEREASHNIKFVGHSFLFLRQGVR